MVDRRIGKVLDRLAEDGLLDNTIIFYFSDHGRPHVRGKQWLYDSGIHVPLIVRWPGHIKQGQVSDHMVMTIDISATILDAAGVKVKSPLHGKNLFSKEVKKRKYIFASRDKMDDTFDAMRTIRSKKYKLIHNLMPERAYCQFNQYKETSYPVLALLNVLSGKLELTPVLESDPALAST